MLALGHLGIGQHDFKMFDHTTVCNTRSHKRKREGQRGEKKDRDSQRKRERETETDRETEGDR